jgi:hypothetical protein
VIVCTAAADGASTDDDVFVSLFDPDFFWPQLDTPDHNDFEAGEIDSYQLPPWYLVGRTVSDIRHICVKLESSFGGRAPWGFGWIAVKVNGNSDDWLYQPPDGMLPTKYAYAWLDTDQPVCVDDFKPREFTAPVVTSAGLPDANSNSPYEATLNASGGRRPLTWELEQPDIAGFVSVPTLKAIGDTRHAVLSGYTANITDNVEWTAYLVVKDADGRLGECDLNMRVIVKLPPPTIASFDPSFGWPAAPPVVPSPVVVTVHSADDDFDSRTPTSTQVLFPTSGGGEVAGTLAGGDQITSSTIKVTVPQGAVPGPLKVKTAFGEAVSQDTFTAHPTGFRFISGYPFQNNKNLFPDDYAWERYEETFGIDEMWITAFGQKVVHDPIAEDFFLATQFLIRHGCCHGFSLSSLQLEAGLLGSGAYTFGGNSKYPLDNTIWSLGNTLTGPGGNLSNLIQSRQLVMFSDEALSYFFDQLDNIPNVSGEICEMDARPALEDVKACVGSEGYQNPRMIAICNACLPWEGHVMVPYGTHPSGDKEDIVVYDPNKPAEILNIDDRHSFIEVDPSSGDWSYPFNFGSSSAELYSGRYSFTIPFEQYGHQYDWSLPSPETLITGDLSLLGFGGTDDAGMTIEIGDGEGHILVARGKIVTEPSRWPDGIRLIPILGQTNSDPATPVALIKNVPTRWIVAPKGSEPTRLAVVRGRGVGGSALGLAVEEIAAATVITHDGATDTIEAAPASGTGSLLLCAGRSFADVVEALRWSVRVHDVSADTPVSLRMSDDQRGAIVEAKGSKPIPLQFDVRVEHRDRMGQVRTLQHDGLSCPEGAQALLHIDASTIGAANATPLRVITQKSDATEPLSDTSVGEQTSSPVVRLPARIVQAPPGNGDHATDQVVLDAQPTIAANPGRTIELRARGETLTPTSAGPALSLEAGSRPIRIIATDTLGNSSFPHDLFVTIPEPGEKPVPVNSLGADDIYANPGDLIAIPIRCYIDGSAVNEVTFGLTARERLSGQPGKMLSWAAADNTFTHAPELKGSTVQATTAPGAGAINVQVHQTWPVEAARRGLFTLGELHLQVPADMNYGSTFIIRGFSGTAVAGGRRQYDLNIVPWAIRIWGGPEPTSLEIRAPATVFEKQTVKIELAADGIAGPVTNCGWWVTNHGGKAGLLVVDGQPEAANLNALRAGPIVVHAVCGRTTAEQAIRLQPVQAANLLALASHLQLQNVVKLFG